MSDTRNEVELRFCMAVSVLVRLAEPEKALAALERDKELGMGDVVAEFYDTTLEAVREFKQAMMEAISLKETNPERYTALVVKSMVAFKHKIDTVALGIGADEREE